jgi:uncharacterized protein (TIGR02680 family)
MNDSLPLGPVQPYRPPLPLPTRRRWQPLRLGLVELFHYDSEEFWFRDGHLLLRGNNGTGKSKVLSLTLPFLFDAQLKTSRIEPDGDATKKMAWNLLLGVHERRTGYAWIEFGRRDDDGTEHYLTLGAGLFASAARPHVDSWYFIIEEKPEAPRIGEGLWLVSDQRIVLSKERLRERLQEHGIVFDTAHSYRRAVDERLFRLGQHRYDALIDTLIQLRQPQLSKKPDEKLLSNALSEALPPLSPDLLTDVADAMSQLEEDRRQLERYQKLRHAVVRFDQRYRTYAGMQSRRQARAVRQAQTEFDGASQERNDTAARLAAKVAEETAAVATHEDAELALGNASARLEALRDDPAMQDANRLDAAEKDAEAKERAQRAAVQALEEAARRVARDEAETTRLAEETRAVQARLERTHISAADAANVAGIDVQAGTTLALLPPADLAQTPVSDIDAMAGTLRRGLIERREHVAVVRRRLEAVQRADGDRRRRLETRDERRGEADAAETRRIAADASVVSEGERLAESWDDYLGSLVHIAVAPHDRDAAMEALATWVTTLADANPAAGAVQTAQQAMALRLAERQAALGGERTTALVERGLLEDERCHLVAGLDIEPPVPATRASDARTARAGAPVWQLVDFRAAATAGTRAGLEAALEAAGLLDAWISPDGRIERADGDIIHDTYLVRRQAGAQTLGAYLAAAVPEGCPVPAALVARLLDGIACGAQDPGDADSWIAPDGRFRLGALAGAWIKPEAVYIGFAARKAARERRLAGIDARLGELSLVLARIKRAVELLVQDRQEADREWSRQPADDPLRKAHATAVVAATEASSAHGRLAEAEQLLSEADVAARAARERLATDAADLRLPATSEALDAAVGAVEVCRDAFDALVLAVRDMRAALGEAARQHQREAETRADHAGRLSEASETRRAAEEAAVRFDILLQSVGAKVEELQRQLADARRASDAHTAAVKQAMRALAEVRETRAVAAEQARAAEAAFGLRNDARKSVVEAFQRFVATGMLASAWPDAPVPDMTAPWTIDPALTLARRTEQALARLDDDDATWGRVQKEVTGDLTELQREFSGLGEQAQAENTDWGLVVHVLYQNRLERPDRLIVRLAEEVEARSKLLTAKERAILENHLQAEIAAEIQRLLQAAEAQRQRINAELHRRPTSTGVRYRLLWQPLGEDEGAPVGLDAARKRLLATNADLWTSEDRDVVGRMLQGQIIAERERSDTEGAAGSLAELLARALDYRRWHRFRIERFQDGAWRRLAGPASSGERALGLTVPLFAAVASYYGSGEAGGTLAPRLILLDEAFAGIDDAARAHCMALIREFDLDFVITSEREWACYAELPGVSICQLQRREGIDAVYVSRWTWDGKARRPTADPDRRIAPA